jgi:gas vesicle protein
MNGARRDYFVAFAIGALVGAAIAFLLTPPARRKQRKHMLEPVAARFRKRGSRLRRLVRARR